MLCCTWISVWYLCGLWQGQPKSGIATVPFLLIFAGGFFYVGFGSLAAMWQMHRDANGSPGRRARRRDRAAAAGNVISQIQH
jgi:hypothetical protein